MEIRGNQSSKRTEVLKWRNNMTFEDQFYKTIDWLSSQNRDTSSRHPHYLTGREIEEIYEFHKTK